MNNLCLCCAWICGYCCKVDKLSFERAITKKRKRAHRSHTKKADSGSHYVDLEMCDQQGTVSNSTSASTLGFPELKSETENALDITNPKVSHNIYKDQQQTQPSLNPLPDMSHVYVEKALTVPTSKQLRAPLRSALRSARATQAAFLRSLVRLALRQSSSSP